MTAIHRKPDWTFYPLWTVLSTVSIPITFVIYWVLIILVKEAVGSTILVQGHPRITEDYLLPYILYPLICLVTGILQFLLLRSHLPRIGWWVAATGLGWSVGLFGRWILYRTLCDIFDVRAIGFELLMTAFVGMSIGLAQWFVLHQRLRFATWWIPANIFSWVVLGWGVASLSNQFILPTLGILLVPGIVTSITWWLLLDLLLQHEGN